MRFSTWREALFLPLLSFLPASLLASLFAWLTFRTGLKQVKRAFEPVNRKDSARRMLFVSKTGLGVGLRLYRLLGMDVLGTSVLLASRDPGSGPFLLWLYVMGTMGVSFGLWPINVLAAGYASAKRVPD